MKAWLQHRVVRHGLFWLGVLAISLLIQLPAYWLRGTKLYGWGLLFNQLPASLLTTYSLLYWILPRLLRQRQTSLFFLLLAGWLMGCALVTITTRAFFDLIVQPGLFDIQPVAPTHPAGYWGLNYTFFMTLVTAGVAVAVKVADGWYEQRQLGAQLRQQQLCTELELLKAQLQPAFLFDTLHALRQLTGAKSAAAPGVVLELAGLLRYMLYESPREAVPLADEVEMLRHYVALEKLRLGGRVEVSLSCSGPLEAHRIAPLVLLPFLENAFRLGTQAPVECPWVSIDLVAKASGIVLKVISSRASEVPADDGLQVIRQRLVLLYPGRHELKVLTEPDTFLAVLHLQLPPAPRPAAVAARAAVLPARPEAAQYSSTLS
ncbi:sensor histidine kinase [Hymenobacter lucidus]|uniref:Histidine kinase n=1 Tax=Hymenobacter lucidus TaxID=2880930 RepID=A0ABS8ARE1_9BACT|nr:histidine kinase [Hymenobacter lucidus]MCB2408795.1 histidine kinase [Hymenobacter lucidus]